jgi:hypothetical protein
MSYCDNCGAEMDQAMNYCRRCGAPSPKLEATTRTLDTGARHETQTGPVNTLPTSAAYLTPGQTWPAAQANTNSLQAKKTRKIVLWLAAAFAFLLILIVAGFLAFASLLDRHQGSTPAGDPAGQAATHAGIPPPPGRLPEDDLVYPGATITVEDDSGKRVLILQSSDPSDKVIQWYREKLKPVKQVGIGVGTVLKGNTYTVMITGVGTTTHIVVTPTDD